MSQRSMNYLPDFLYVIVLVHAEGFNRHSFIVVNAFPNISKSPRGDRMLSRLDEAFGYRVGSGEQTGLATKLTKPFEYLHIVFRRCKSLHRVVIFENRFTKRHTTFPGHTLSNTSNNACALFPSAAREKMYRLYNSRFLKAILRALERA